MWDIKKGKIIKKHFKHTADVFSVHVSKNQVYFASSSRDKRVRLWDLSRWEEVKVFVGHTNIVRCVRFSPDNKNLISCSADKSIHRYI